MDVQLSNQPLRAHDFMINITTFQSRLSDGI